MSSRVSFWNNAQTSPQKPLVLSSSLSPVKSPAVWRCCHSQIGQKHNLTARMVAISTLATFMPPKWPCSTAYINSQKPRQSSPIKWIPLMGKEVLWLLHVGGRTHKAEYFSRHKKGFKRCWAGYVAIWLWHFDSADLAGERSIPLLITPYASLPKPSALRSKRTTFAKRGGIVLQSQVYD